MTPVERLEKLRDKILAWSAYKSLVNKNEDSKKLDGFVRELEEITKEMG